MTNIRLHASAEDLTKDFLSPHRIPTTMGTIGAVEVLSEELQYDDLTGFLQQLENNVIRKPDHFNNVHFLLLFLYDASGYPRDRYPLWRWYHRIKKKLLTGKHVIIDSEQSRQTIFTALEHIIDTTPNIATLVEEGVQVELQYLNPPIHDLFKSYSPLHTYLYLEQMDKPILNENAKVYQLFQTSIIKLYQRDFCDLIHFAIAHKKSSLLNHIFGDHVNWLNVSMNSATERGWLPLHYASYVGDRETVKTICDSLTSATAPIQFDPLGLFIPVFKKREFEQNPNGYILKACSVEDDVRPVKPRRSSLPLIDPTHSLDSHDIILRQEHLQAKKRSNIQQQLTRDQPASPTTNDHSSPSGNSNVANNSNDNDIPDADELELSSLPLIQREEFIDKVVHGDKRKERRLIPSPLVLACAATCGNKADYEEIVKLLLESRLVEFDGLNHECILSRVVDYMQTKKYATFQHTQVYRQSEIEGPSAPVFYQFEGFIVSPDVKPLSGAFSTSSITLNTSKNEESAGSDDGHSAETPISVRCFLTVLVLRDIFLHYPRWDFHLLRANLEDNIDELERALGCRPVILHPDGEVISSRKRSDVTWEVTVKYRFSSENGRTMFMQVDYNFFESFADPLADGLANDYQTPFYISCMTDSTTMMDTIFDSFFTRRHRHCWGTVAEKHLEHCFDGVLQTKNNCTTFVALCTTLSRFYQVLEDPFMEENSATIQRIFVHAFACCVRRNAKIELDYLIKNHALYYYDSCRLKPSDIRHNILTYCVVRNLANVFDQLMTNMKTTMYKTYQNSTNPDWQPHIAWREIIHVIIDPVSQQSDSNSETSDFSQLACYGNTNSNFASGGSILVLHTTGEEYLRCINIRKNIMSKARKKLPRTLSDANRQRPLARRLNSLDQQHIENTLGHSVSSSHGGGRAHDTGIHTSSHLTATGPNVGFTKRTKMFLKNANPSHWKKNDRNHLNTGSAHGANKRLNSPTVTTALDELSMPTDAISLVSNITF